MMEKIKAGEITGQTGDYMLRATAANGQIRAFAATSRDLVEKARQAHNTSPVATAALGRLMTAGVMMGSMMKADSDLLTIRVEGDGPIGGLTVTFGKVTLTSVACALILGILTNVILGKKKEQ